MALYKIFQQKALAFPASQRLLVTNSFLNVDNSFNIFQTANYRKHRIPKERHGINWARKKGGSFDEHMTQENKEFLNEAVLDKYKYLTSPLKNGPWVKGDFNESAINKRLGVLAIKLGSIPQWTKDGKKIHTNLLQVLDNHVIDYVPPSVLVQKGPTDRTKNGQLGMAIVGSLSCDPRNFSSEYLELFKNSGVPPKRKLTKFMVSSNAVVQPGTPLYANHFRVGDYVDVGAKTIGFGFQGVMKRWGFKGGPRSHGSTKFHRKRGTMGSGRDRRPLRGTKMAGRMGQKWRMQKGLKIWRINTKYNILYIHGPVIPGPNHCYVRITDSSLPKNQSRFTKESHPPYPTFYPESFKNELSEEYYDANLHNFADPTIRFENVEVKKTAKRDGAKIAKIK
jgi:large subunit ribosomal protein L3